MYTDDNGKHHNISKCYIKTFFKADDDLILKIIKGDKDIPIKHGNYNYGNAFCESGSYASFEHRSEVGKKCKGTVDEEIHKIVSIIVKETTGVKEKKCFIDWIDL